MEGLQDYTESIDAIGRATKALKAQDGRSGPSDRWCQCVCVCGCWRGERERLFGLGSKGNSSWTPLVARVSFCGFNWSLDENSSLL